MADQHEDVGAMLMNGMKILAENDADSVSSLQDYSPLILFFPKLNLQVLLPLFLADVAVVLGSPCVKSLMNLDPEQVRMEAAEIEGDAFGEEDAEEDCMEEQQGEAFLQLEVDPVEFPVAYDFARGLLELETPSMVKWCHAENIDLDSMPLSASEVFYRVCSSQPADMDFVRYFLDNELDPNHISKHGTTVFNGIILKKWSDLLDLFIEYKVEYVCDRLGRTPLHCCAKSRNIAMAEILLEQGQADPDIRDWRKCTPLHLAARLGDVEMAELLCEYEANPDAEDMSGMTPVHYAAAYGKVKILDILYEFGADLWAMDSQCMTGMNIAVLRKKKPAIKWFAAHGVTNDNMTGESDSRRKGKSERRKDIRKMMNGQ